MSGFTGFVEAALQLGLESILIKPTRGFYGIKLVDNTTLPDILAHAVIEEHHHDELEITDHPVEQGAMITDHAFKRPAEVTLRLGWSNSPQVAGNLINAAIATGAAVSPAIQTAANVAGTFQAGQTILSNLMGDSPDQIRATYQKLLQLQSTRALFTLYTGKRTYTNMLCKSLATETDFKTENSLIVTMTCRQVILVNTQTITLPAGAQKNPELTTGTVDNGQQAVKPAKMG